MAEVQEENVTVKGHRYRFIANSLSDLLDQFLLRRHKNRHDVTLGKYGTCSQLLLSAR
jgi:hypothetical protein